MNVFMFGILVMPPIAFWTLMLVLKMVDGELDGILGTALIGSGILLGYMAIAPSQAWMSPVALVISWLLIPLFYIVRHSFDKKTFRAADLDVLERMHENVRKQPDNHSAKFKVAEMLYQMGYKGQAYSIAANSLPEMPQSLYIHEHAAARDWYSKLANDDMEPVLCLSCNTSNEPGGIFCTNCDSAYLLERIKKGRATPAQNRQVAVMVAIALLLLLGVPALMLTGLPTAVSIIGLVVILGLAAFLIVREFATRPT